MDKFKHLVYSYDLEGMPFLEEARIQGINCISSIDSRSAIYIATGIAATTQECVFVYVPSNNTSRSVFSGMTEAYYRNLPIVLVTIGEDLDYSLELKDIVYSHYKIFNHNEIKNYLKCKMPMHIELITVQNSIDKIECYNLQLLLAELLNYNDYLYIGQGIYGEENEYRCKTVIGGMPHCYDGAIANVLGASLSKKHKKYIGLISENEFLHDMNTLGNIHVNNRLAFIVLVKKNTKIIVDYAKTLEYDVIEINKDEITTHIMNKFIDKQKKRLLIVQL